MTLSSDSRGADLPMLGYAAVLTTILGLVALGLFWLHQPYVIPNPGLAAYKATTGTELALAMSPDTAMAMERSAQRAAGETHVDEREAKLSGQKAERTAQSNIRKPPRVASRPALDDRRPQWPWGYAQSPFPAFGRWF